jgi:hypothetical protein
LKQRQAHALLIHLDGLCTVINSHKGTACMRGHIEQHMPPCTSATTTLDGVDRLKTESKQGEALHMCTVVAQRPWVDWLGHGQ